MPEAETVEPTDTASTGTVEPTETDEPLGEAGKRALAAERKTARDALTRAAAAEARIKEFEDRDKSESEKLQERADSLAAENAELSKNLLRRDVAETKGLTPAQAKRLVGTTREELEADADDILENFPVSDAPAKPAFSDIGQGHRGSAVTSPGQQLADIIHAARR